MTKQEKGVYGLRKSKGIDFIKLNHPEIYKRLVKLGLLKEICYNNPKQS
jgi:hypothetical protein